jgi:competence protein ComQ
MLANVQERLRHELQVEVEREGGLYPDLTKLVLMALSEEGKPLHTQSSSFWSDLTFHVADLFELNEEQALPVAIAVELALLSGDIFDDLIDQDSEEAIWSTVSTGQAIILANWIYSKAYSIINSALADVTSDQGKVKIHQTVANHMLQGYVGQWLELKASALETTEEEYLQVISLKAGKLVEMVFIAIATLSNQSVEIIRLCSEAGMNLGIASQIENDILDLKSPYKSDLLKLSPSIPLIKAIESSRINSVQFEKNILEWTKNEKILIEKRQNILDFIQECGALDYSYILFHLYQNRAIRTIELIASHIENKAAIERLKKFMGLIGDETLATKR